MDQVKIKSLNIKLHELIFQISLTKSAQTVDINKWVGWNICHAELNCFALIATVKTNS